MNRLTAYPDDKVWYKGVTTDLRSPTRTDDALTYEIDTTVTAPELDRDASVSCAPGISFSRTLAEALRWAKCGTVLIVEPIGTIVDAGDKLRAKSVRVVAKADLYGANLSGADLSGANLYGANLSGADLSGANLYRANLSWANLSGADLSVANLSGADLSVANLYRANLSWASLYGANLYGANLSGAGLHGANLYGANLSWAIGYVP